MAELDPEPVQHLFRDILFVDGSDSPDKIQQRMDDFIDQIESLRLKLFPRCWKYKHDRHIVSFYLAAFAPEHHYIYKYSDAEMMARDIGFESPLGSGQYFSLPSYYAMCDIIVDALKQHPTLIAAHQKRLSSKCYHDCRSQKVSPASPFRR